MQTTPSTLSPLEAYEALMLFARRRGEGALRLAMHAAVPQQFRPDLLHLLKLNFLPRELHDPAAEADVLFSPLCEETGRGYFEFGPHVRTLLLDNLAANYADDPTPRISRVANFLLFYVEQMERRAAGGLDRLWRDYLEVQRWVALAFLDPDNAARQLAAALKGTSNAGGEVAARLRLGGLASALSSPLVKYRHVLNYAAGLQALEAGDHARAQTLLSGLGDQELNVGGILLRPATELLRAYSVQTPKPPPTPEPTPAPEPSDAAPPQTKIFISYSSHDRERAAEIAHSLKSAGHDVWLDTMEIRSGERWGEAIQSAMKEADFFIVLLSRHSSASEYVREEIHYALSRAAEGPEGGISIIPILLEPCEIPQQLAMYHAVDLSAGADWSQLASSITRGLEQRRNRDAHAGEREEKIRDIEALAGSDDPGALETLTEAVWREEDARVRLAAVKALSKSRSETALEALLVAAGDGNAEVYRAAVDALADAEINAVLIYGFFGTDTVENREVLREELRRRGYVPLVFPFARPFRRGTADIPAAARPITRFAIADLTAPPEILEDLAELLKRFLLLTRVPLILISQGAQSATLPAELRQRYPLTVLPLHSYSGPGELRENFDRIVTKPVAAALGERREPAEQVDTPDESERPTAEDDSENAPTVEGEQTPPGNVWEEFLMKVAREVESVMQREMFTPPGGDLTFIPPEYIVYLSSDDDKEWQGEKRRGLEQGLYHLVTERARELSGQTKLAFKQFAVELRVDGTLNKGEFRVQPVWESKDEDASTGVKARQPLPFFTNDIFISYAHADNNMLPGGIEGWVNLFHERLSRKLTELLGAPPVIWRESQLRGGSGTAEYMTRHTLRDTLLMVVVVSPAYVKSEMCLQELRMFLEYAERNGGLSPGGRSRLFVVMKTSTKDLPTELKGYYGYEFFQYDETTESALDFRPDVGPGMDSQFQERLGVLAWNIIRALEELKPGIPPATA